MSTISVLEEEAAAQEPWEGASPFTKNKLGQVTVATDCTFPTLDNILAAAVPVGVLL
jgi:hypothetical protein